MTTEELYEYIESYLEGDLQGDALMEFERRRQNDPEFAAEVALHERMQSEFADIQKIELRGILDELGEEFSVPDDDADSDNTPPPNTGANNSLWWILGIVILLIGGGIWYYSNTEEDRISEETTLEDPLEDVVEGQDAITVLEEPEIDEAEGESRQAALPEETPADIVEESIPDLEALVGRDRTEDEYEFRVRVPAANARLTPQDGQVNFKLSGTLLTTDFPTEDRFLVHIYRTDPLAFQQRQPETSIPLKFANQETEDDEPEFAFGEKEEFPFSLPFDALDLPLEAGLYYYVIVLESTGDIWYVGKLRV